MPRVDAKRLPSTQLQGFSGGFRTRADANDFGAGTYAAAGQAAGQIADAAMKIKQERDNADLQNAENALNKAYHETSANYKTLQGKEAADGFDQYKADLKKAYQGVRETLPQGLHDRFGLLTGDTTTRYTNSGVDHRMGQHEIYLDQSSAATVEVAMEDAAANYTDQSAIHENLGKIRMEVMDGRLGKGLDAKGKKKLLSDKTSEFHAGIVTRMLQAGDTKSAEAYYTLNKANINNITQDTVEAKLNPHVTLANAQEVADGVMLQADSITDATKMVKDLDLPAGERQKAEAILRQRFSDKEHAERVQKEEFTQDVWDRAIQGQITRIEDIPPELDASQELALQKYLTKGAPGESNQKLWTELKLMRPADLAQISPYDYVGQLRTQDYNTLLNMVKDARQNKGENLTQVQGITSKATKALKNIGIDLDDDKGQLFMRRFQDEVTAYEQQSGKKASPTDVDDIIDRLLIEGEVRGGFFGDPDRRLFQVEEGEQFFIDDIPSDERSKIEAALGRAGIPATDEAIEDLYTRKVLNSGRP